MTGYLIVMGWLATIVLGAAAILALALLLDRVTQPRKAEVGDDAIAMVRATRAPVRLLPAPAEDIDQVAAQWAREGYGNG